MTTGQPNLAGRLLHGLHAALLHEFANLLRPPPTPPRRWWSPTVRTLHTPEAVAAASRDARNEYATLFTARTGMTPPDEWLDRWWPTTRPTGENP